MAASAPPGGPPPLLLPARPAAPGASPYPARLEALRRRLDALREGRVEAPRLWDRVVAPLQAGAAPLALPTLVALARELDRVGVHTLADAQLLRALEVRQGAAGALAGGLAGRVEQALAEFERGLRRAERGLLSGRAVPGAATALEAHFPELVRAARVADTFRGVAPPAGAPFLLRPPSGLPAPGAPRAVRLAVVEHLAARARAEVGDVAQKRRDLDVAHELLLRAGEGLEREREREVRREVAEARERLEGVADAPSLPALLAEVRRQHAAVPQAAYRALSALHARAVEAGREELGRASFEALACFLPEPERVREAVERGPPLREAGWVERDAPRAPGTPEGADGALADLAFRLAPEQRRLLDIAAGASRFLDVEEALGEVVEVEGAGGATTGGRARGAARGRGASARQLELGTTGDPAEAAAFLIEDPRRVLYDLAGGRQWVLRFREPAPSRQPAPRRVRRSSVRVYLCDASGSMHGHRARFRDALLLAELEGLRARERRGLPVDPLYFCFFNDAPKDVVRVDGGAAALRHMEQLFQASPAEGQTDITLALVSAFGSIRAARGTDPSLARATVVLVTDGEDRVDLPRVREAREPVAGLPIALSLVSLGEENPDLRALAEEQRARGGRAFYQHLTDDDVRWAQTAFATPWRTLLPPDVPVTAPALEALAPHLEALEALARGAPVPRVEAPEAGFDALFPAPEALAGLAAQAGPVAASVSARVADVLEAVVETAALVPAPARARESAALLEHLRGLYGLSLPAYLAALAGGEARVGAALRQVRLLCRPLGLDSAAP